VNDKDRTVMLGRGTSNGLPERLWVDDDVTPVDEDAAADFSGGLASVGFIKAALRRSAWVWCLTAVIGLLLGLALLVVAPPAYQATTSVLLTHSPLEDPLSAMGTDTATAQSTAVAALALRQLGLNEPVDKFVASYTAVTLTDRVLQIQARAPSSDQAVREADAVAAQFLRFRANELQAQQQKVVANLDQQIATQKQHVTALAAQITQESAQPATPNQRAQLAGLRNQHAAALSALNVFEQTTQDDLATTHVTTTTMIKGSVIMDAAVPVHRSHLKLLVVYGATALVAGLALGIMIVAIRALVSDRLRRRDDVARALGAPVRLSVGAVRISRWLPSRRGLAAAQGREIKRIAAHLRRVLDKSSAPKTPKTATALAVVSIDNPQVAALAVVSLALSAAQQGKRVIVADLSESADVARLLGIRRNPGVSRVTVGNARLEVAVPDHDDLLPSGPVGRTSPRTQLAPHNEALADAYASADLLLTVTSLDPAVGAEHLKTWASDAVALVTAGRSSVTRVQTVAELIRLAETPLVSAVLIGADKRDESLGAADAPSPSVPTSLGNLGVVGR
jgi:capsular polysaccharide biosynthesis protein